MNQSFQFQVTGEEAGHRLDEFLASRFAALSRMRLANLVRAGACRVNGLQTPPGHRLVAGDLIAITFAEGPPTAMQPEPISLETLYEDDHIIVVVKPAGMLVHPTKAVKSGTLANALAYHLNREFYRIQDSGLSIQESGQTDVELRTPRHGEAHTLIRPGLVHRLDRATSGLMVVAKTARALSRLTIHFRRRLVEKRYLALAGGVIGDDEGAIAAPIGRDPERRPQWWVMDGGREAETRFRVRERFEQATLIELEPVTGRTNQLRIHCAYAGHPIIGDVLYGDAGTRGRGDASRLCLHASRLAFYHPASNERLEFDSPLPDDFARSLDSLRAGRRPPLNDR